ncbi:UNVERIFIED_CONTAM: hypothetical protein FKN15_039241, partial [Acipenser sinensis]
PISTDLLLCLITALQQGCFNLLNDIVMETLCLTAAFGFLRYAEFSTSSTSSFPALGLKLSDLSQMPRNHFILQIRSSETVQLSQGFSIFRQIPSSSTAPDLYLRDTGSQPVYAPSCHGSGFLRTIFPPHSFWIGAAASAARAGINQHLIKSMGRWISSVVELYIRSSSADIEV